MEQNPIKCRLLELDEVDKSRHFTCKHYEACLDRAMESKWRSFNCKECAFFKNLNHLYEQGESNG